MLPAESLRTLYADSRIQHAAASSTRIRVWQRFEVGKWQLPSGLPLVRLVALAE